MPELLAQKVRRVMIDVVSCYDSRVVSQQAHHDSEEFQEFLRKAIYSDGLDMMDIVDIESELNDTIGVTVDIDTQSKSTWAEVFDKYIKAVSGA